ncbi:hypothetical protein D3C77_592280 [compost metagenome]
MLPALTGTSSTWVSGLPVARSSTKICPALVPMTTAGTDWPSAWVKSIRLGCMGRSKSQRSLCTVWYTHFSAPVLASRASTEAPYLWFSAVRSTP